MVTDPILRALCLRIPRSCTLRAYADDIAIVLTDVCKQGPAVAVFFIEIAKFSRLTLKPNKCVIMFLWKFTESSCRRLLKEYVPSWGPFNIDVKGKYLGFGLGQGLAMKAGKSPQAYSLARAAASVIWAWDSLSASCCIG